MSKKNIYEGISLFSSSGIGEYFLSEIGIDIKVANELIPKRADLYQQLYPDATMITGDITQTEIFNEILRVASLHNIEFMIASPPCQGISVAGKNRKLEDMSKDERNYLIMQVVQMINTLKPKFIIIENVPLLLKLKLNIEGFYLSVQEILEKYFQNEYIIEYAVLDTADYGTAQVRKRAIIKMHKKGTIWPWPKKATHKITVYDAIGDLPSIESGQQSGIKWHFGRIHSSRQIEWMKHTPTGHSAFENKTYFPQKEDGTRIKGYLSSYRRIKWNQPAPTITIRNDAISSQRNVHPGRPIGNGIYSDSRVLSILELFRLTGLPDDWPIPTDTPELLIRQIIGECIPPKLIQVIAKEFINEN